MCPLIQTRITITISTPTTPPPAQSFDDDSSSTCSYFLDVVKPPSVEDLYDWYTTNTTDNDADPSWANVWETEVELIRKYIEHDIDKEEEGPNDIIIEVGAGLSFAGLLLAKYFRKKCLLLDREPLALHCALSTAKVNGMEVCAVDLFEDTKEENKGIVAAAMFDWSKGVTRESLHLKNKARTIIGADVLYDLEAIRDLVDTVAQLRPPLTLLAFPPRHLDADFSGSREMDLLVKHAGKRGLRVERRLHEQGDPRDCVIIVALVPA